MTNGINSSQGWNLLKNLVANSSGKTEVSNSDVQNILSNADTNNDNVVTEDEFIACFESSDLYKSSEEEDLGAFKVISMLDGDASSMSAEDITAALQAYEQLNAQEAGGAGSAGGAGDAGGTKNAGGTNNTGNTGKTPSASTPETPSDTTDTPVDLGSQDLQQLQADRAAKIMDLSAARTEKSEALSTANANVNSSREFYNAACTDFTTMVQEQVESNEQLAEVGQAVIDLQSEKDALNGEITAQEAAVTAAETAVSTISSSLGSLTAPPQTITVCVGEDDDGNPVYEEQENPDYATYLAEKAALEAQLAEAENDVQEQQTALESLEADFTAIEAEYAEATTAYTEAAQAIPEIAQAVTDAQNKVNESQGAYDEAQAEKAAVSEEYDANIADLESQVDEYDKAIAEKELEEQNVELPEGYEADEEGNITNGEFNLSVQDELPEGYTLSEDGTTILDADGKEAGTVSGTEDSPKYLVQEEVEPESLSFRERYAIADDLYNNPDADWSQLDGLSDKDIQKIESLYDDKVEDYNEQIQAEGWATSDDYRQGFAGTVETQLNESNPDLLAEVKDSLSQVEENDSFADYIAEQGGDFKVLSDAELKALSPEEQEAYQEQLNDMLNDYTKQECGFSVDEIPNDGLTPELRDVIGEDALAMKEGESQEEYETRIKDLIKDVMDSTIDESGIVDYTYTPEEQMQMLNYIKNFGGAEAATAMNDYFGSTNVLDSRFKDMLESSYPEEPAEGASAEEIAAYEKACSDYASLAVDFMKFNAELNGVSDKLDLSFASEEIVTVFENASSDDLSLLKQYVNIPELANQIQWNVGQTETELLTRLMTSLSGAETSVNPEDYGIDADRASDLDAYNALNYTSTEAQFKDILNAVENGDITKEEAQYLFANMSQQSSWVQDENGELVRQTTGSAETLVEYFRSTSVWMQEARIEQFFGVYADGVPAESIVTTGNDSGNVEIL